MFTKILCVDDDAITLMLCKKVIAKAEFASQIETSNNGEEALQYFENLKKEKEANNIVSEPQLIFLDLNMPIMNGWEFLDIFSKSDYYTIFPEVKVIVLSSTIDPRDIEKAKQYPMVLNFLSKPITIEMLKSITI
ncbi:response regulator [Flavobacterium sp.]|jgi:CheY-like chemotaxis protein|nr:response regulator [Flavobacterium sp.]HCQ13089.1 response regulator [Flavobacterium sp.]